MQLDNWQRSAHWHLMNLSTVRVQEQRSHTILHGTSPCLPGLIPATQLPQQRAHWC